MSKIDFSRRKFVKSSLALAGSVGLYARSQMLFGESEIPPSDQLSAAIIGCGGISRFHAEHHLKPYIQIKAICDVDRTHAEAYNNDFAGVQAEIVGNYQELLHRDDIDVFIVCTPDHWHTKITIDAMRNGKDVYCEKPLTLTVDEGRLIRKALSETNRILQVGTQQRSSPEFQTAVALAQSGRLGKVKKITVAIGGGPAGGPFQSMSPPEFLDWDQWQGQATNTDYIPQRCHGNFRWWYEYSGGKMTDWGAHHVDIARWALDKCDISSVEIDPVVANHPIQFEQGLPAVHDCYNTATTFRINCRFNNGTEMLILDNAPDRGFQNGVLFECEGGRYFVNRGKLTGKPVEELSSNPLPAELLTSLRKGAEIMPHFANFYWSCRNRTEPISDAANHTRSLDICHLANIAMRFGRKIDWDSTNQQVLNDEEASQLLSRKQREGFEIS